MTTKDFLILSINAALTENNETLPTTLQDEDNHYKLIYEYNPNIIDILKGIHSPPFIVYECNDNSHVVVLERVNNRYTPVDVITLQESEEHGQYNAMGIHVDATIMGINQNEPIESKIDTGADCCSLGVSDIHITKSDVDPESQKVKFTYNERNYTMKVDSMVSVQTADGGIEYRPTVLFNVKINGHLTSDVAVNLNDRTHMEYKFLIGMNLLSKSDLVIDPSISENGIQLVHNILNETIALESETVVDNSKEQENETREILEVMLKYPNVSFRDILSMTKLDTIAICERLQS